ncbi:hypothetical protein VV11_011270 [Trichodesmium erythraeum 21-75]|nr:hypothetical protein [Trichodesmium erythraeum 21-75]
MNLSKTAKRFLSSTMAIALAGGSVLAFGSSSLADDTANDTVSYTGTVPGECSLITASASAVAGSATNYGETRGLSLDDLDDDPTSAAAVTRVTQLQATDTLSFDCNTGSVNFTVPIATATPPTATGSGGSALVGSHTFAYNPSTNAGDVTFTAPITTAVAINTDNNGDVDITVTSTWAPTSGEELLKGTYTAEATFQVVAN